MPGSNIVEVIRSLQQHVERLEDRVSRLAATGDPDRPRADPSNAGGSAQAAPGAPTQVYYGRVVEALPFFGWYRVFPENGNAPVSCCLGSDLAATPVGVRRIGALQPMTRVFYVRRRGVGVIIAAEPAFMTRKEQGYADWVSQTSTNTPAREQVSNALLQLKEHGIADFSNGGAVDETAVGEWGLMAETGVTVFIDPFMAFLRADDNCGFWAFYHDQLARVSGRNLQVRSAGREDEQLDDEGEFTREAGTAPYSWEGLGAFDRGTPTGRDNDNRTVQMDSPEKTGVDVKEQYDQYPFFRSREYGGYLGQGWRRQVVVPPPEARGRVNRLGAPQKMIGVFDEQVALDGTYTLRSAQGVTIAHVPPFPVATRKRRSEDAAGDSRAAGYDPAAHKVRDNLPPVAGGPALPGRCLAADDDLAYSAMWRGDHPFHYHDKDWDLPDAIPGGAEQVPFFGQLAADWFLEPPAPAERDVDFRYREKFYQLVSMFKLSPDGAVVLAGGCGEEIRMAGGSVEISAPGDVYVRSGRNVVAMAGRDLVLRGHKNVDLSAAQEDVRVKAEGNLMASAGNGGTGVLLLESRSPVREQDFDRAGTEVAAGGVVIRAKNGVAAVLADEVYVRSGADGGAGPIVLDAAKGAGPVVVQAATKVNMVANLVVDAWGTGGAFSGCNLYSPGVTAVSGALEGDKSLIVRGFGVFGDSVSCARGHVFTADSVTYNSTIPELTGESLAKAQEALDAVQDDLNVGVGAAGDAYETAVDAPFYQGKRVGADGNVAKVEFSFRTTDQCKTADLVLFESRWQQRARLAGQDPPVWDEPAVQTLSAGPTRPWPGDAAWDKKQTYLTVDLLLYDLTEGAARPRGPEYEAPAPATARRDRPSRAYTVVG